MRKKLLGHELLMAAGFFGLAGIFPIHAHAVNITNVSFSATNVTYEQGGIPNGTTVSFTIDTPGQVQMTIAEVENVGDPGVQVASIIQNFNSAGAQTMFWNGLWLINGAPGRIDGNFQFTLTLSTGSGTATVVPPTFVTLNSVDIHNVSVAPSFDASGLATFPYTITYSLAKQANVTLTVLNSSGTLVRTLMDHKLQVAETISSTQTVTWDGSGTNGPAPTGNYSIIINALDPLVTNSSAYTSTQTISVASLAGAAGDPKKNFNDNTFVYPNPIRDGVATFQYLAVRDGATITLRIYTITGTLVLDKNFGSVPAGAIHLFPWNADNQSGNRVGRGLYFYVMRESDPQGVIEVTKKLAVIK